MWVTCLVSSIVATGLLECDTCSLGRPAIFFTNLPFTMPNTPKKSVAQYLEEREKAQQVKSIKDYFGQASKVPNSGIATTTVSRSSNSGKGPKRMVEVWKGGHLDVDEYQPEREYGLYKRRYGEKPHKSECLLYIQCQQCVDHDCGLCRIEEIANMLTAQEAEADRRWNKVLEETAGMRGGQDLDTEWMREQDPIWAKLVDNNAEMDEDLKKYMDQIEKRTKVVKQQLGWM